MRRIVCIGALVLLCGTASAWGPGAHFYVAQRVLGTGWGEPLYAAMLPDMVALGATGPIKSATQHLTHFEFYRLAPSAFAAGFSTHNGEWGADYYSHCYYDPSAPDTYLTSRMKQFALEFGCTVNQAEDVMEGVVDLMLRRDLGPDFGRQIAAAPRGISARARQDLIDALAEPLSARVPGLSVEAASVALQLMLDQHLIISKVYGDQLAANDMPFIRSTIVSGFAQYFGVSVAQAETYVSRAEELCWDYQTELDAMAGRVAAELASTPNAMPVGGAGLVAVIFAILGAWQLLRVLPARRS
jgi:hypothetical protein